MMTFHSPQLTCVRRVCKQANVGTFNFTSLIASSIYAVAFTKRVKPDAAIFESRCSRTVVGYRLDRVQALPLSRAKVSRLANGSPELARSPARWSSNVRDTTGKTSGEISRATVAQYPRNRQAAADALSPEAGETTHKITCVTPMSDARHPRRKLARQPAICSRNGGATVAQHPASNS